MPEQGKDTSPSKFSDRLSWLKDISEKFGGVSSSEFQILREFLQRLDTKTFDIDREVENKRQLMIIKGIFLASDARSLADQLGRYEAETKEFLNDTKNQELWINLLKLLLNYRDNFAYQIAVLGTLLKNINVVKELFPEANVLTSDYQISFEHKYWDLCGSSEVRLQNALDDTAVLVIDDFLLLKFYGRLTALCLKDAITPSGQFFLKGCFYSPTDSKNREQLRQDFYQNSSTSVMLHNSSAWVVLRPVEADEKLNKNPQEFIQTVDEYVKKLPSVLPDLIHQQTRQEAAESKYEDDV